MLVLCTWVHYVPNINFLRLGETGGNGKSAEGELIEAGEEGKEGEGEMLRSKERENC